MSLAKMKKVVACLLIFCMSMYLLPLDIAVAYASQPERLEVQDGYLRVSINTKNGRYAVRTTGGMPSQISDNNKQIIFEKMCLKHLLPVSGLQAKT